MERIRRSAVRALVALLLVSLTIPGEILRPDPAAVAAAILRLDAEDRAAPPPAAPGVVRSSSSAAITPVTSLTIAKPAGTTTNDLLLAAITVRSDPVISPPAGWTLVRSDANTTTLTQAVYRKVATGSEPASYTFGFSFAVESTVGAIGAYSGVDTTTPVDVSGGQANASSTSVTAPSVTTTVANTRLVGIFGTADDATFSPPSGMTERSDVRVDATDDSAAETADVAKSTAGATGTKVALASIAAISIGQLVALRPAGTIAFRAASTAALVPITSLTIATPSGVVADDVLLAAITDRDDQEIHAPAGWTLVRWDTNAPELVQYVFVRTAAASEPANHTFTFERPISAATGGIVALDDIDPLSPIDTSGGQANAVSTSVIAPSITTTVADTVLVGLFATAEDRTFSPPAGMTERFDQLLDAAVDVASTAATVSQAAVGATGTKVATASGTGALNIGALVALRPLGATTNLGQQAQHTFESWDLGAGDGLAVNAATRNAVLTHPLVSLPIRGSAVSLTLVYNAKDTANLGLGPGWRLDVFRRLRLHGDGTVTFTDGSGARHLFTNPVVNGSLTTYTRPATLYATLVKDTTPNPDRFTLTYRDQSKDRFDVGDGEALLVRAEDRFANGVDLAYVAGTSHLATITDTVPNPDRTIDLAWSANPTPDRLLSITDWAYVSGGVVQTTNTGTRRAHRFFFDGQGQLAGWADPVATSGACPTTASHLTCLAYAGGLLSGITKTQTYTTLSSGTLGTATRTATTELAYAGSDLATVTDAHQQAQGTPLRTTFTAESATVLRVDRPTTTTTYGQVGAADPYGRIQSVWRKLDATTSLETRTSFDAAYPIEPATVTANYGALLGTPARTTTYTYVPSSMGLVAKIVEPLTATDERWTEYVYNTNNDVVLETVSLEGSATDRTVTKSCYTTQSNSCADASPGLTMVRRIDRFVSGGPSDEDTNVVTDYAYDAYGQLVSTTRSNRDPSGAVLDSRQDRSVFDGLGNATAEIANYGDGVVTPGTTDIEPAGSSARTDLTTTYSYDTAGNRVSSADPRRAIAAAATTYARDAFGRTVSGGWGTADTGGTWSQASAELSVDGTAGKIALGSITNRNNYLTSVSFADGELLAKVKIDRLATGDNHLMWFYLRRQGANDYYQARLSFETSGLVKTSFARWSGGLTTTIKSQTTAVPHAVTDWYWLRARISGSTSVNAKLRLWKDGTTEPAGWDVDGTDASPPAALQGSGHIGVRFELGSGYTGAFPATASFDELTWTTIGGGGQALGTDDYVTRTTFDALNEPITTTTPTTPGVAGAAGIATTAYDELGAARSATDVSGIVSATVFDRAGRALTTYEDPAPAGSAYITAQMTYDADGKTLTAMDRRQAASPGFALGWTASGYDGLGRQTSSIEAQGSTPDVAAETRTTYDGLDRVTATEVGYGSPASQLTSLTLDLGGRATATDDGFTCTTSTYDYRDLVLTTVDSLDPTSCAANAGSRTVTNTLDALGRVTQAEVTAGPDTGDRPSIATYDGAGNALTAGRRKAGVTTTTTFSRTLLDQVVAEARPDGSTAKATYDPAGNAVDACTWASGLTVGACLPVGTSPWSNPPTNATSTRWDARNGRIALTDAASNRTTTYDPAHGYAVSAVYLPTLGDGTKEHQTTYGYDTQHRLTSITQQLCTISSGHACSSTTATGSDTYEYDDSDNRTRVVENNGNTSSDYRYCHDARNQLTGRGSTATCTTSFVETFTFDDAGNRSQAVEAGVTRNFAYTATGLLCDQETGVAASCSGGNVTSDDAGRVSDQAGWHYLYDAAARLVAACHSTACTGSGFDRLDFEYDGEGHRTKITETPSSGAAVVWTFRYQGDAIVAEYRDAVLVREYTVDDGGTISKLTIPAGQTGTGTYLVTWNGHGDALALYRIETSGSLTLANSYTYSTWGRPATLTHNGIADLGFRFLYVGAADVQWDGRFGADLLYMHARHYSPSLGRFLQGDPSRQDAKLFVYAGNRIVAKADPSGLASYAARAWVGVKDCSFPCADVVLTAIELRLYWTTRTFCIPCKPLINTYRAVPIAYSYHYGLQTGAWYPDPAVSWVGVVSGGYKRTYVTMKFVQGFKYYGLFNLYVLPAYYNRLTIWIAARSDGSFSCAFGYYIKTDPFLVKFQYPSPRCGRIY